MALNKLNHIYGEPLVVSSLNTTGDTVVSGSLTVLGSTNFAGAVTFGNVSNAELQYLDGLTGNIQTQLNDKVTAAQVAAVYAPLAGATFTGAISATDLTLTNNLTIANGGTGLSATTKGGIFVGNSTTAFTNVTVGLDGYLLTADSAQATGLKWAAAPVSLPTQTSNSGKFLTTDGTSASWTTLNALPTQTGNAGKFLTTDATTASWATLTASNLTGGTLSSTILGNSALFIGTTSVALNRTTANLALTGITSVAFPGSTSGTTTVQASAAAGTTTFTLPATTGTACLLGNTFFVGTTSIANNRASASQTLTGVSIDGNAATASGLGASLLSSAAGTALGTAAAGTSTKPAREDHVHPIDTSRLAVSGGGLTGLLTGSPTASGVTILNSNDNGNFSVRSIANSATSPASMSFHRPGIYAINMGLDTDNNFKIGGWSAGAIMMTLTGGGALTVPGQITAGANPPTAGKLSSVAASGGVSLALSDNVNNSLYVRHSSGGAIIGTDGGNALRFATGGSTASEVRLSISSAGAATLTGSLDASGSLLWECADAGSIATRIKTGVYQNSAPTTTGGWPVSGSWYHLISATHNNTGNYYSMQIAGSFFDNSNFYIRSTNNSGTTAWLSLITSIGGQTINGNLTLSGTLTINSDARIKENLTPLTGALDKVKALTGYNYNRIGSDKLEMGVVAQEVQKVAPELVLEDKEGTLSVAYQNMVALLIEAVKEQSAEIAALKEQVEELRG